MKFFNLYLIEGEKYYTIRSIKLPEMINVNTDMGYCFTNTQSLTSLFTIILLRLCGKEIYFLPDGIFECSNIKRIRNILGFIALKISNGVLAGDIYSYESAKHMGLAAIKVSRWRKAVAFEKDRRGNKIIIATAKNPFFNQKEKQFLTKSLEKVIYDFDDKSRLITSMPKSIFNNLPVSSFGIQNLIKCNDLIYSGQVEKVISAPSTLIIDALVNDINCSLLPFRAADYILVADCNYPNEFTYESFVFFKLDIHVKKIDSFFASLNIFEQSVKKLIKNTIKLIQ